MPRAPKAPGHYAKIPWDGSNRRQRLPDNWPQISRTVLERDGYQCQVGYDGCLGRATDTDHITAGDDHRPTNLQAACSHCHAVKSSAEGNAARWGPAQGA